MKQQKTKGNYSSRQKSAIFNKTDDSATGRSER